MYNGMLIPSKFGLKNLGWIFGIRQIHLVSQREKKCCNFQFLVRLFVGSYMYIFENQAVTC